MGMACSGQSDFHGSRDFCFLMCRQVSLHNGRQPARQTEPTGNVFFWICAYILLPQSEPLS